MEQHVTQEQQIESADSANTQTVESTTIITEKNGHVVSETLEVQNLESMIPLVSSTIEIPHKEEAQVPCANNTQSDDNNINDSEPVPDDSNVVEIHSDQKEAPDETNKSLESKDEVVQAETNDLCSNQHKIPESDSVEDAYSHKNIISTTDNENDPDYMTMDQEMLPDCVNQNCDRSDQSDFQSNEVLSEIECNQQSANQEDAKTSAPVGENETAEETIVLTETIVPETTKEDSLMLDVKKDVVTVSTCEESDLVVNPEESREVEVKTEVQEEIRYVNCEEENVVEKVITDSTSESTNLETTANIQNDVGVKHLNSEAGMSEELVAESIVEESKVKDLLNVETESSPSLEDEKSTIEVTKLPEESEVTNEEVQEDLELVQKKISTTVIDDVEAQVVSAAQEVSESDVDKDATVDAEGSNEPEAVTKRRSVIQDIVDDWTDENNEDPGEVSMEVLELQDSVEIQLESLLDGGNSEPKVDDVVTEVVYSEDHQEKEDQPVNELSNATMEKRTETPVLEKNESIALVEKNVDGNVDEPTMSREIPNYIPPHITGKTPGNPTQDFGSFKHKPQSPRPGIKVPGRHLSSPIVSTAEVAEVLKERIKEKQKDLEVPRGGDIFFVKKIAQRLSSKLSAGSAHPVPGLIPLPAQPARVVMEKQDAKALESAKSESNNIACTDNRELLAILEGDVDPDWSNLKTPALHEVKSSESVVEHTGPSKLDPSIERELALKQLLELPSIPIKKNTIKKKKTFKPAPSKMDKLDGESDKNANLDLVNVEPVLGEKTSEVDDIVLTLASPEKFRNENTDSSQEIRSDESRSGRKRKPTEKAREHEQNTSKRQKVYKGKVSKKLETDDETSQPGSPQIVQKEMDKLIKSPVIQQSPGIKEQVAAKTDGGEIKKKQTQSKIGTSEIKQKQAASKVTTTVEKQKSTKNDQAETKPTTKDQSSTAVKPKQKLLKKGPQPIVKRKLIVKKLLRQRTSQNSSAKKSVGVKAKLIASPKKSEMKVKSKVQKRLAEQTSPGDAKPKKKTSKEIDKLLQDEGVVNLLYDVEQSDKKRRIPITKSQTKVMDMQKIQRELKIRTKLVRNAVLRLRTSSSGSSKVSPRSKRTVGSTEVSQNKDKTGEQIKSPRSTLSSPTDFIFPAKIRNAADASIIIRRHSSSSFSSASGSPRVSIDAPDRQLHDISKLDAAATHVTRSAKGRFSRDGKTKQSGDGKKSKKKVLQKVEEKNVVEAQNEVPEEKVTLARRSIKRMMEIKKREKMMKRLSVTGVAEKSDGSPVSKIVTRSNGSAPSGKVIPKSKKGLKSKVSFGKALEIDGGENQPKQADELSACLAAAATALSSTEGVSSRSGGTTVNRKLKGNFAKTTETDGTKKQKGESSSQFVNKEINVRWHGNLVQLILTPSSSTKLRNSITLQVMGEMRDTLSILRRNEKCRVVLLTSTGGSFCEGLELSGLLHANKDERRARAQEMAVAVKDFIKCLTSFNKPIVAGVQGAASGLGVTMLSLFDLVVASDKATFSTPYAKLGQIPEGAAVLTLTHTLGSAITSELLLGGRTLTASEAMRAGLVTRVLWPDRFQGDLLPSLKAMSEQSSQSMEATKALLRHNLRKKLDAALESESYLLVQHWCSDECQAAIKDYIERKAH